MPVRENKLLDRRADHGRADARNGSDVLMQRAAALLPEDRRVVELFLKNRLSHRQLANIMHVPAGTVTRRLRRLFNRLNDPLTLALLNPVHPLPDEYRQVAIEHFVQARTIAQIADFHQIKSQQVRAMIEHVRGWHRGVSATARRW